MVGTKKYTEEEIAKHNSADDCWIIISGKVYLFTNTFIVYKDITILQNNLLKEN